MSEAHRPITVDDFSSPGITLEHQRSTMEARADIRLLDHRASRIEETLHQTSQATSQMSRDITALRENLRTTSDDIADLGKTVERNRIDHRKDMESFKGTLRWVTALIVSVGIALAGSVLSQCTSNQNIVTKMEAREEARDKLVEGLSNDIKAIRAEIQPIKAFQSSLMQRLQLAIPSMAQLPLPGQPGGN